MLFFYLLRWIVLLYRHFNFHNSHLQFTHGPEDLDERVGNLQTHCIIQPAEFGVETDEMINPRLHVILRRHHVLRLRVTLEQEISRDVSLFNLPRARFKKLIRKVDEHNICADREATQPFSGAQRVEANF